MVEKTNNSYYLHEAAIQNKKEDETPFKTRTEKIGTPSGETSSIR